MALMFQPLVKYADFTGRARRAEYWLFTLFLWVVSMVLFGVAMADSSGMAYVVIGLACLGILIPSIAVTVRRLHDTDRSGLWALIAFVPFVGGLVIFIFSILDGTPGPNRFGPDPKGREGYGAIPAT